MHAGPDDRCHQELLPEVPAPQPNLSPAQRTLSWTFGLRSPPSPPDLKRSRLSPSDTEFLTCDLSRKRW